MTDNIKLPPLPFPVRATQADYSSSDMQVYAIAAIEPYAKRIAELEAVLQSQDREDEGYSPRKIGSELFHAGFGISDLWGSVKYDLDMDEAMEGYMEAKKMQDEVRLTIKDIERALVGIRRDNHPRAYRILMRLKSAVDHARRVEGEAKP